jgi:hypothetical protein
MNKDFVPYEQALALKELGFDEPCLGKFYYNHLEIGGNWRNDDFKEDPDIFISAPLYQQAFRWFREKHKINSQIAFCEYGIKSENSWKFTFDNPTGRQYWEGEFKTYEEAEHTCLDKLIRIVTGTTES